MAGSDIFNPYSKWLAIPPEDQPPNLYRLLGIRLLESDPEIIDAAAEQRTGFLRKHQAGPHSGDATRLLNEVSAARLCLLNPAKKAAYDAQLQATPIQPSFTAPVHRAFPVSGLVAGALVVLALGVGGWVAFQPQRQEVRSSDVAKRSKATGDPSGKDKSAVGPRHSQAKDAADGSARDRTLTTPVESASPTIASSSDGQTFQSPPGTLVEHPANETTDTTKPPVATADALPATDMNKQATPATAGPMSPSSDVTDVRLLAAIAQLDKAEALALTKYFKKLKADLQKCKVPPSKQKAYGPALLAELDKMIATCDRNEFPPMRVQGTRSFNGHDYAYINVDYTWNTARELSEAMGGHLATLNSSAEAAFAVDTILRQNTKYAWLGASDQAKEGDWHWITGEPFQLPALLDNDWGAGHALTWLHDPNIAFTDVMGDARSAYLCEWESTATPELIAVGSDTRVFQAIWGARIQVRLEKAAQRQKRYKVIHQAVQRINKETGSNQGDALYAKFGFDTPPQTRFANRKSEYFLYREGKTWHEAVAHCERAGGHLVILNDPIESEEIVKQAVKNEISIHIGCSDEYNEGQWRWLNGQPVRLPMIKENYHGHTHVGLIEVNNKQALLRDGTAGGRIGYVCEWELD